MNKKTLNWMLMAAVVLGLSMNFASCSSDDDDDKPNEEPEETDNSDPYGKNSKEGIACFNLLSQLAGVTNDLPDNWKSGATFNPIAGIVMDESQPFVRSVVVDDVAAAAEYYNELTDKTISATATKDTWTMEDVGTLAYTATNKSDCFATIDVNVKQLPKLTQLRLIPQSALNNNAAFEGEPYYCYGDVVKDRGGSHWICVRPCYQPKGIDTSYWISFQINDNNIAALTSPGLKAQQAPKKWGSQKPSMKYLAQLLAILSRPDEFQQAVGSKNFDGDNGFAGLPVNPGFSMTNEEIVKVAKYWEQDGVWEKVKPARMSVSEFKSYFNQELTFIYNNYTKQKSTLVINIARYSDANNFFRGTPKYLEADFDMTSVSFDVRDYIEKGTGNYNAISNKALTVHYKNGKTLSEVMSLDNIDATKPIDKVTTVYRFKAK